MVMSEVFYTGLYSSLIGFILALGSQCYKSKCKEVNFCCIKIIRDVEGEEQLDNVNRQNPLNRTQSLDRPNERQL
jgi:hypothetical protein